MVAMLVGSNGDMNLFRGSRQRDLGVWTCSCRHREEYVSDTRISQLIQEAIVQRYSRRDILRRATALGLSASAIGTLLAACGGGSTAATPTAQAASSAVAGSGATPA